MREMNTIGMQLDHIEHLSKSSVHNAIPAAAPGAAVVPLYQLLSSIRLYACHRVLVACELAKKLFLERI